jgi:hypothetical protein
MRVLAPVEYKRNTSGTQAEHKRPSPEYHRGNASPSLGCRQGNRLTTKRTLAPIQCRRLAPLPRADRCNQSGSSRS